MKVRIIRITLLLSIPLIIWNIYLSINHPFVLTKERYASRLLDFKTSSNIKYIVLGDSHAGAAFKDHLLSEKIYNLSGGGDGFREMYIKFRYALRVNNNIECTFISCDYHMFGSYRITATNRSFYYPFIDNKIDGKIYSKSYI